MLAVGGRFSVPFLKLFYIPCSFYCYDISATDIIRLGGKKEIRAKSD